MHPTASYSCAPFESFFVIVAQIFKFKPLAENTQHHKVTKGYPMFRLDNLAILWDLQDGCDDVRRVQNFVQGEISKLKSVSSYRIA